MPHWQTGEAGAMILTWAIDRERRFAVAVISTLTYFYQCR